MQFSVTRSQDPTRASFNLDLSEEDFSAAFGGDGDRDLFFTFFQARPEFNKLKASEVARLVAAIAEKAEAEYARREAEEAAKAKV